MATTSGGSVGGTNYYHEDDDAEMDDANTQVMMGDLDAEMDMVGEAGPLTLLPQHQHQQQVSSWDALQVHCGLSDLDVMQLQDQQYKEDMRVALRASLDTVAEEGVRLEREVVASSHFDDVFLPNLTKSSSLTFEQLCCALVRGFSKRCGYCAVNRDQRFQSTHSAYEQQDPLYDFCPHLICSEWAFIFTMRSISKAFWKRFLATRVGQHVKFCFPRCYRCYWTTMYVGHCKKVHDETKTMLSFANRRSLAGMTEWSSDTEPDCLCRCNIAEGKIRQWCSYTGLDPHVRVCVYACRGSH